MQCSRERSRIIWARLFPSPMTQARPITTGCTLNFVQLCECRLRKSAHLSDREWAISSDHIIKEHKPHRKKFCLKHNAKTIKTVQSCTVDQ